MARESKRYLYKTHFFQYSVCICFSSLYLWKMRLSRATLLPSTRGFYPTLVQGLPEDWSQCGYIHELYAHTCAYNNAGFSHSCFYMPAQLLWGHAEKRLGKILLKFQPKKPPNMSRLLPFLISSVQYVEVVRGPGHVKGPLDKTWDLQMALADMAPCAYLTGVLSGHIWMLWTAISSPPATGPEMPL